MSAGHDPLGESFRLATRGTEPGHRNAARFRQDIAREAGARAVRKHADTLRRLVDDAASERELRRMERLQAEHERIACGEA